MKRILVSVDFSANSVNALKYAINIAAITGAKVSVLYVYSLFDTTPDRIVGSSKFEFIDYASKAYNDVEKLVNKTKGKHRIKTEILVKDGIPEVVIVDSARKIKADLIVIGRTGNGAMKRFFLGSTVANVLNMSKIPVLVIPAEARWKKMKRIVFATDLSEETLRYADKAAEVARYFNAELCFLYIDTGAKVRSKNMVLEMTEKLKKRVNYPKTTGFICEDITVREGLTYYFSHFKADMAIMVTHHYSFPQLIWKHSSTQKLSASFNIPLLAMVVK
jgi:nucleotide-binding universal stress UspA family protein